MTWDLSLIKKIASNSHYKLLKQVRNELRAHPTNRKVFNRDLLVQPKTLKSSSPKANNSRQSSDFRQFNHLPFSHHPETSTVISTNNNPLSNQGDVAKPISTPSTFVSETLYNSHKSITPLKDEEVSPSTQKLKGSFRERLDSIEMR